MSFLNANQVVQEFVLGYGNTGRTYGAINYFKAVSDANTSINLEPAFTRSPGKYRKVMINYIPLDCGDAGDCSASLCDTGEVVEPAQQLFDVTECISSRIYTVNKDDIRMLDGNWTFSDYAKGIIASMLPNFRRLIATAWTTKAYTLAGRHLDGSEEKRIPSTDPNTGRMTPMGLLNIEREYLDGGFTQPYILGGGEVYNWTRLRAFGGVNDDGINIAQLPVGNVYYDDGLSDQILNDTANGHHILSIAPESFKLVTYLQNAGIFRTASLSVDDLDMIYRDGRDGYIEGTLVDPVTGLAFDLYINYDKCYQYWTIFFRLHWDMFVLPEVACNGAFVNGLMHWRTCPDIQVVCPAGSPVTSPAAATTFSWTPTLANIDTVANSVIGGIGYQLNNGPVAINNIAQLVDYMNEATGNQFKFVVNGSAVNYSGYAGIGVSFNSGDVTGTFA